jgi:sec-independent protein translocase protein TatC
MSADDRIEDSSAPLIEHLAELRTRLIRSVMAFVVAMVACFTVAEPILELHLSSRSPTCWSRPRGGARI